MFTKNIRSRPCPHCLRRGYVICHGSLTGKDLTKPERITRGIRFLCSNRNSGTGCGRTFSVLFDHFLPRCSVPSYMLTAFLKSIHKGHCVHKAWNLHLLPFSLRSAYRWLKQMTFNLARIRPQLHNTLTTPPPFAQPQLPLYETIHLLKSLFPEDFVKDFQGWFQTPFFL